MTILKNQAKNDASRDAKAIATSDLDSARNMAHMKARRPCCARCLRAQAACICRWIVPIDNMIEVLVLQHPLEAGHAKGSAQLLHLSLARNKLVVGETFEQSELTQLLAGKQNILLYPETVIAPSPHAAAAPAIPSFGEPIALRLIVLDGTWRKSRKMLFLNPLLETLPRLPLRAVPPSHYLIRKAHRPDQLSTLEACCYAMMQLEGAECRYTPLLDAFDGFVAQQLSYLP